MEGVAVSCSSSFNLRLTQGYGKLGFVPLKWKAAPIYNMLTALSVISMQWRESPHRNKSSKGTRLDGRETQTANSEHCASAGRVNLLVSPANKYLSSFYPHIFPSKTSVNIHMHALGPSRLFGFESRNSGLHWMDSGRKWKKQEPVRCTDTDLKVRLLWLNLLLLISWVAVISYF